MASISSNKGISSMALIITLVVIIVAIVIIAIVMSQSQSTTTESPEPTTPTTPTPGPTTPPVTDSSATVKIEGVSVKTAHIEDSDKRYVVDELSFTLDVLLGDMNPVVEFSYELYDSEGKLLKKAVRPSVLLKEGMNNIVDDFSLAVGKELFSIEPMKGTVKITIYDKEDQLVTSEEVDVELGPQGPVEYDVELSLEDTARFELSCRNEGYAPYMQPTRILPIYIQNMGELPIWGRIVVKLYADDLLRAETTQSFFLDVVGTKDQLATLPLREWNNLHNIVSFATSPETIKLGVTVVDDFSGEELLPEQDMLLEMTFVETHLEGVPFTREQCITCHSKRTKSNCLL